MYVDWRRLTKTKQLFPLHLQCSADSLHGATAWGGYAKPGDGTFVLARTRRFRAELAYLLLLLLRLDTSTTIKLSRSAGHPTTCNEGSSEPKRVFHGQAQNGVALFLPQGLDAAHNSGAGFSWLDGVLLILGQTWYANTRRETT